MPAGILLKYLTEKGKFIYINSELSCFHSILNKPVTVDTVHYHYLFLQQEISMFSLPGFKFHYILPK